MPQARPALKHEPKANTEPEARINRSARAAAPEQVPPRLPNALAGSDPQKPLVRPVAGPVRAPARRENGFHFQTRVPVITGEATYRGWVPVDGIISGQLGANGSALSIRQRARNTMTDSEPELNGELCFKDMLRVNGHVAGKVISQKGTLIVDSSARMDADIEVGVAVIGGTVNGDVIGHERVELGPGAVINGNISTRSLAVKPGAVFQGDCRMLKNENAHK